jgi:hypothetical protein
LRRQESALGGYSTCWVRWHDFPVLGLSGWDLVVETDWTVCRPCILALLWAVYVVELVHIGSSTGCQLRTWSIIDLDVISHYDFGSAVGEEEVFVVWISTLEEGGLLYADWYVFEMRLGRLSILFLFCRVEKPLMSRCDIHSQAQLLSGLGDIQKIWSQTCQKILASWLIVKSKKSLRSHRTKKTASRELMRNLICLGRTRTALVSGQSESEDLPVTGIAPIPSSEDAFFVAHGPICTNQRIEILRVQVQIPLRPSWHYRTEKVRPWLHFRPHHPILTITTTSSIFDI